MNKLTYLVILTVSVLYTSNSVAQSFSLPSPSASSMTRYVGTSVNESSGRVVKSIPLYNYQAGNLSIPLGLTYVGNGVKVDQQSNWTGTNWDLSYGGVVTRTLNHLADEKATNRLTVADIPSLTDPNNIDNINDILQGVNQTDDLRPDVFTFTFPGYSGSFYFDNSGTPRLMDANTKLKIEFSSSITNGPINTIVITTMSGVEYYFGGDDASESTSMVLQEVAKNVAADTPPDFTGVTETITAFYLYKIKHPFGDEILFDYHDDGVQILSRFFNGNGIGAELSNGCKAILYYAGFFDKSKKQIYWGKISGRKKISKIHSPNSDSEIRFNSTQLYLAPVATNYNTVTPQYDDRRLNSIHVYNNLLGENTKQIKLSYIDTPYRFFLEEVEMNNETDVNSASKCSSYKMEYDDVNSLPHRFSLNQDMLGYYRGPVIINGIPSTYNGFNHVSINNSSHPGYVKKGALKKMYYPSGGHTFFEYETPAVATLLPINISLFANKGQSSTLLPNKPSDFILSFSANQAQEITVNVNIQQTNTSIDFPNDKVYIKLYEYGFPANPEIIDFVALVPGVSVYNQSFNFSLKKGVSYRLELNANSVTDTPFIATATTSFVNKTIFPSSGLRVEKISDYPKEGDINPLVKKYYYKRAERALSDNTQEDEESGVVTYAVPTQVSDRLANSSCCSVAPENSGVNYLDFRSDPFSYYFAASDNLVSYKYVTVSLGGDNFEEGGVEKHFKFETNIDPVVVTTPFYGFVTDDFYTLEDEIFVFGSYSDNNTVLNGALLSETHVKKGFVIDEDLYIANDLHKVKETNYTYSLEVLNTTEGLILTPRDNFCLTNDFDVVSLARYKNRSYSFNLVSVKTKEYISKENNPTYQTNDFVETEQTIEYNTSLKFLPSKISNTNSNGDTQITKNYYLTDLDIAYVSNINPQIISSSAQSVAYEYLKDNNRVGAPIFTESYIKKDGGTEQLRSQQRILFNNFGGLTLPETEETSKLGSPLEKRTTYTKYDDKGYILEMSSDNNITTSVIYGYKDKKIIAQLVNVAHGSIVVTGSTVTAIQGLSNVVTDQATMDALEVALDGLRAANPDGRITTYVYNRLGQLSSMKDARGYKMSYEYDECYRLKRVKDHLGNILKENQYNIINNN